MAFSNNLRKTLQRMSGVLKPIKQHGLMRTTHVEYNTNKCRHFESVAMRMGNNQFGVVGSINNGTKSIGFDNGNHNMNDNYVDNQQEVEEEEEEDIDIDFLFCNEKLCKDNENRYYYFFSLLSFCLHHNCFVLLLLFLNGLEVVNA